MILNNTKPFKKFKNMSENELTKLKARFENKPFSPFGEFCHKLSKYDLYLGNIYMPKWEIYYEGYKDADKILNGETKVKAIKK